MVLETRRIAMDSVPAAGQPAPATQQSVLRNWLDEQLKLIESHAERDVLSLQGPIWLGVDHKVRVALEALNARRDGLLVILDTGGGVVEVAERIATTLRSLYNEVQFLVPDRAMSAGTVLVMSGDDILMDYYSCLGPIDPQIQRDDKLVPALSYLTQFQRLMEKSTAGTLTTAELVLLKQLDLAELDQFQLAAHLSVKLIKEWLVRYKFKDWDFTEESGDPVTDELKETRAQEIASALNQQERWLTHSRGIPMDTLQYELKLRIRDYSKHGDLYRSVRDYFNCVRDFAMNNNMPSFVHSRAYF